MTMVVRFGGRIKTVMIAQHNGLRLLKTPSITNPQKKSLCLTIG